MKYPSIDVAKADHYIRARSAEILRDVQAIHDQVVIYLEGRAPDEVLPRELDESLRMSYYRLQPRWETLPQSGGGLQGRLISKSDIDWGTGETPSNITYCQFRTTPGHKDFPVYLGAHWHPYPEVLILHAGQCTTYMDAAPHYMVPHQSLYIPGQTLHRAVIYTPLFVHGYLYRD